MPSCWLGNSSISICSLLLTASTVSARAVDEIQVYNAEIAKIGQWTFQLHNNYAFIGRKEPDFPGGLIPNHALNGTGEWAWGMDERLFPAVVSSRRAILPEGCSQTRKRAYPNGSHRKLLSAGGPIFQQAL